MIVGIDPGQKGGIVLLRGAVPMQHHVMPAAPRVGLDVARFRDLLEHMAQAVGDDPHGSLHVVLEKAQSMPKQGVSSVFKYARDYGAILGVLHTLRIPFDEIHPATWHRAVVGARRKGEPTTQAKARALAVVSRRLPTLQLVQPRCRKPHDGIVDAACLALWGLDHRDHR